MPKQIGQTNNQVNKTNKAKRISWLVGFKGTSISIGYLMPENKLERKRNLWNTTKEEEDCSIKNYSKRERD